ncbi:MAG: ABC-type multidrug transport system, ATPase and permease component [Candidatus Giovannonibacteria bacterium GW2011_GWA2_44_26]|uniref:ABC-type multidrug transport system, ATPase and permease component n=1 Tax=Candidatus Giovannonibacteria bacterium GW2011_GWA2_44_26 TaxID=1618648 RepID=A0A0G1IXC4_9BACT|nr:MAG: ABC-type multidrug transport system, ATPase and permease component [Candidatus Giovannonibacteria bacterium GW2011_GWA2_44_26]
MAKLKKENLIAGWRIILKYLKPHKEAVFVLGVFSVISAVADASVPYLAGKIVDNIKTPVAFYFIGTWVLVRILGDAIDWRSTLFNNKLQGNLESEYLAHGHGKLLELSMPFHKTHKMGEVANRISRASNWLNSIIGDVIINLAPRFLSIIFALAFAFYIKPVLALALIAGVLIYCFILTKTAPQIAEMSLKMHRAYNIAYGDAYDAVLNVQSVKQATAENYEKKKMYRNFFTRAYGIWFNMEKLWSMLDISQRILVILVQLSIFIFSVAFVQNGTMTIGELVMFNGYAAMFFGPFVVLGNNWRTIQNGVVALERAEKILNLPTEPYVPQNAIILEKVSGGVEFQNLNFSYNKKQGEILKNISFKVSPGESVALVGESGVGKSTLVDLISYYYKPTSGKILIDGHNLKNFDLKFLRSQIAVVPQEILLFNDTVKNNISYGSFGASDTKIQNAARFAHADEFIENFPKKYEQMVGERGIKLSMGQKQRVALARAFLRNPKILILDEPTSALDAKSERYIQDSFKELMRGRTTFIIAHRLSTVREVDEILVLDQGAIVERGSHDALIKKKDGIYRKLYELQLGFS